MWIRIHNTAGSNTAVVIEGGSNKIQFLIGEAELLGGGSGDTGQGGGAGRLGQPPDVPLGGEAHRHHVVLVDVVQRHVADLAAGHDDVGTGIADGLQILIIISNDRIRLSKQFSILESGSLSQVLGPMTS
jgi:hypothetical protein